MKLIVVDVGNTSTAVGLWRNGRVTHVAHADGRQAAARTQAFAAAQTLAQETGCAAVAYLSVVPKADATWRRFAKQELRLPFVPITHRLFQGAGTLRLDYPHPETIGADRLADAAAAVDRYGAPVVVCDFGTAFTAAAVTADCVWRGGVIAPGFPLMRDYLYERTAKLPRLELGGRVPKIGRSTEEAMRFGALVGYRGMVREIVSTLAANFKVDFRLVATGGFAKWVLKDAGLPFVVDSTLTLHGAGLLAARQI
ncbi:MAG: type III pantothenate kinase [Kiritimatiellae bacterium]|nr:type III pantothenate kinase [Kiritimatiellia bacterium]